MNAHWRIRDFNTYHYLLSQNERDAISGAQAARGKQLSDMYIEQIREELELSLKQNPELAKQLADMWEETP